MKYLPQRLAVFGAIFLTAGIVVTLGGIALDVLASIPGEKSFLIGVPLMLVGAVALRIAMGVYKPKEPTHDK